MLIIDLNKLFKIRGINNKMSYLMQKGFTHSKAQSLTSGRFKTIKVKDIEKLCLTFNCTPNDLFTFIPEEANPLPADSALNAFLRSPVPDVSSVLKDVTIQEASELLDQLQKLKNEK